MERPFQAYEGNETYVFVCYSHDDAALVYPEITRLKDAGFCIWYDEGITPGSEWSDTLANHIKGCAAFLYFATPRSVISEHCRREVNFALEQPCGMLAVHLEPTVLPSGLQLTWSNRQAILKYDEPAAVYEAKLASAIRDAERRDIQESPASMLTLGGWTLDVGTRLLARDDESHALDPKVLSVLLHLLDRAPEVVSRQGLIDRTWPGVVVGENVLDQAITQLRRALGDDPQQPSYIETIPRHGYRLVAPLAAEPHEQVNHGVPGDAHPGPMCSPRRSMFWWLVSVATILVVAAGLAFWRLGASQTARDTIPNQESIPPDRSLTVMDVTGLGDDPRLETYAKALTAEVRGLVTDYSEVNLISAPDGLAWDEIQGTSYVFSGHVERTDDTLRVRTELIRTRDRQTVWAQTFEDPVLGKVPDSAQVAVTVGQVVRQQLDIDQRCETVRRRSRSAEAADAYCASLAEVYRSSQAGFADTQLALARALRAVALDPDIAEAHLLAGLNYCWLGETGQLDWRDAVKHAREALGRFMVLAPADAQALALRGRIEQLELNYPAAIADLSASVMNDPLHPLAQLTWARLGNIAMAQGRLGEALEHYRRALRIYDANAFNRMLYAVALYSSGQYREALREAEASLRLIDTGPAVATLLDIKAGAQLALGERARADATLDEALTNVESQWQPGLVVGLAALSRTEEALELLAAAGSGDRELPPEAMGAAYAALGDERAFDYLHEGIDRHLSGVVGMLRVSPVYLPLHQSPRWDEVMAHLEAEEAKGRSRSNESG